jgi:thiol-disulfide isomerase/thioredoxin
VSDNKSSKPKKNVRSIIEWSILISVVLVLYLTGWHTQVIGTLQRGILATGLITPDIPENTTGFETANLGFSFTDESGAIQSLSDFRGEVIFMNVWATWCPPCIAEMPSIHSLYSDFKDDENISFILVSMDEDFEKAKKFMATRGYNLPIYHYRSKVPGTYQSSVIPTTYIISPESEIVLQKEGFAKYDTEEFKTFLRELSK